MSVIMRSLIYLALGLSLSACAGAPAPLPPAAFAAFQSAPYALGTGDRLRVIVFGQDNLSNLYTIDSQGRISMPLIDIVSVAGLTTQAVERVIEAKLRNGFIREPKVSVEVETYRPFFVLGEVTNSGQFPYVNSITLQKAIAIAGGFTPRANQNYADVTRMIDGKPVTAALPLTSLVRPGDAITVRERWF